MKTITVEVDSQEFYSSSGTTQSYPTNTQIQDGLTTYYVDNVLNALNSANEGTFEVVQPLLINSSGSVQKAIIKGTSPNGYNYNVTLDGSGAVAATRSLQFGVEITNDPVLFPAASVNNCGVCSVTTTTAKDNNNVTIYTTKGVISFKITFRFASNPRLGSFFTAVGNSVSFARNAAFCPEYVYNNQITQGLGITTDTWMFVKSGSSATISTVSGSQQFTFERIGLLSQDTGSQLLLEKRNIITLDNTPVARIPLLLVNLAYFNTGGEVRYFGGKPYLSLFASSSSGCGVFVEIS